MCNRAIQGLDIMNMIKPMKLTEQIQYDLRESNKGEDVK